MFNPAKFMILLAAPLCAASPTLASAADPQQMDALVPVEVAVKSTATVSQLEGEWFVKEEQGSYFALFGPPQSDAVVALICDAQASTLTFAIADDAQGTQTYRLGNGAASTTLRLTAADDAAMPYAETLLDSADPALASLALQSHDVEITYPDGEVRGLPSNPAIATVLAACE